MDIIYLMRIKGLHIHNLYLKYQYFSYLFIYFHMILDMILYLNINYHLLYCNIMENLISNHNIMDLMEREMVCHLIHYNELSFYNVFF